MGERGGGLENERNGMESEKWKAQWRRAKVALSCVRRTQGLVAFIRLQFSRLVEWHWFLLDLRDLWDSALYFYPRAKAKARADGETPAT